MQCAPAGMDTLFNWLRPLSVSAKKGGPNDDLTAPSLGLPPTVALGDQLTITLAAPVATPLTVTIEHADSGVRKSLKTMLPAGDVQRGVRLKPDTVGAWRVIVQPEDRVRTAIADWVYVFER